MTPPATIRWSGGDTPYLDAPDVTLCGHVVVGRFGGRTAAGARKNEDAALVWTAPDGGWTFAALMDAHGSSESADLVLARIGDLEVDVARILGNAGNRQAREPHPFTALSKLILEHLRGDDFRQACAAVRGETALLLCAQKDAYLWWLSIGDVPLYVFHPEFARLGQFALNQRMFFEWIGQVNTFALAIPCFATGVRQLRTGQNRILLATDGLLECGLRPFENPRLLYGTFCGRSDYQQIELAVRDALEQVNAMDGRDSATLIAWDVLVAPDPMTMQPTA